MSGRKITTKEIDEQLLKEWTGNTEMTDMIKEWGRGDEMNPEDMIKKWSEWRGDHDWNNILDDLDVDRNIVDNIKNKLKEEMEEIEREKSFDVYGDIIGRDGKLMLRLSTGEIFPLDLEDSESALSTITTVVAKRLLEKKDDS